jgi:hypothetical protein
MRSLLVSCVVLASISALSMMGVSAARAEKRIFIIANIADGYGVDRCLSRGERCGQAMATSFCQTRNFTRAASFRKVAKGEITGGVPLDAYACTGRRCEEFVAIECVR